MNAAASRSGPEPKLGKDALLDAAATLFDEVGIDAVSMNEIVRVSGHRNRSAISYHFGTKDDVVRAVVERSMVGPDARRHELLDGLLAEGIHPSVAAVATVVVQPLSEQLDTPAGRRFLRLLGQLIGHPRLLATAQDALSGNTSLVRAVGLIGDQLDHLPDELRRERMALLVAFVMRTYADQARLLDTDDPARPALATRAFTDHLVGLIIAILAAPAP